MLPVPRPRRKGRGGKAAAAGWRQSLHQKHGAAQRRVGHCGGSIWQRQIQQQQVHSAGAGAQGACSRPQRRLATHRTRVQACAAGKGCLSEQ